MRRISHPDVGAWVLKGNPAQKFNYEKSRADKGLLPGSALTDENWSVGSTYRSDLIRAGDLMVLYMGDPIYAVVEIGVITSQCPHEGEWDKRYVLDPDEVGKRRSFVSYDGVRLAHAIPRSHPALAGTELLEAPHLTNPSMLTQEQTAELAAAIWSANTRKMTGWVRARWGWRAR